MPINNQISEEEAKRMEADLDEEATKPKPKNDDDAEDEGDEEQGEEQDDSEEEDSEQADDESQEGDESLDSEESDDDEAAEDDQSEETVPKHKFVGSYKETLITQAKNKKLLSSIDEASQITTVTDEDLKVELNAKGIDITTLDNGTRELWRENILNKRKFDKVNEAAQDGKDLDAWALKIDTFVDDPKTTVAFPKLVGREAHFRSFSMQETKRGVPMEDLVKSFLYDAPSIKKHKGSILLSGSAGGNNKPKPKAEGADELSTRRNHSQKDYMTTLRNVARGKQKVNLDDF